jgi:multidrug resistance efflux pump
MTDLDLEQMVLDAHAKLDAAEVALMEARSELMRARHVEGQWYVPVKDLNEVLDVLERLYDHIIGVYSRSAVFDHSHALDEAEALLRASHRR